MNQQAPKYAFSSSESEIMSCDCGANDAACWYMAMNKFAFEEHTLATERKDWLSDVRNEFHGLIASSERALMREALAAARGSHAPYSGCPSGVAVLDCDGRVYRGSYVESVAACHLSLMPVQAALVSYMVGGGGGFERIVAAVLVEKEDAVVAQEETARLILNHISPKCEILVVHCR